MTTTAPQRTQLGGSAPTGAPAVKTIRRDIQGLRAIAVLAVVADHLFHWPTGGFVGVDVFFVISGYLITGLLLREHDRTGTISFSGFYKRRARRIVPAAALVLTVTSLVSFAVFNVGRATQTSWDAFWSLLFVSNWHFALGGTDYFQAGGPVSPLQHFWSLSVEEQFYFIWPWLMLLIFLMGGRSARWDTRLAHRVAGWAMAAIVIISFGWSLWETATNPTWSYFSTFTRTWELGIGAMLAVASARLARVPGWLRPILGWGGFIGIVASVFFLNDQLPFPGPWAALPVISTALVIVAGSAGTQQNLWPLTNPVAGYIGRISYSLYLWHFPVIILLASAMPSDSPAYLVLCLVVMALVAVSAFHLVEDRILRSSWLLNLSTAERRALKRERRRQRASRHSRYVLLAIGLVAVSALVLAYFALLPRQVSSTYVAQGHAVVADTVEESLDALGQRAAEIRSAIMASSWPTFDPAIDNLVDQRVPQWTENGCLNVTEDNVSECVYGPQDASGIVVVLGDSIATSWLPGIIEAVAPYGFKVQALTMESCPFAHTAVTSGSATTVYARCADHQQWVTERVAAMAPEIVIASDSYLSLNRLASRAEGDAARLEWQGAYGAALDSLPGDSRVIALATPPGAKNLQECYTPISSPSDCIGGVSANWQLLQDAERSAAEERGVAYVDTQQWFCQAQKCPSFVGTTAMFADTGHLTAKSSALLAPVLEQTLVELGLLTRVGSQ